MNKTANPWYEVKRKREQRGNTLAFHKHAVLLMELKAFEASMSNKPQPSPERSSNISEKACIAPSIPDFMPDASWSTKHSF